MIMTIIYAREESKTPQANPFILFIMLIAISWLGPLTMTSDCSGSHYF
jgi:hypothetical protein